MSAVMISEGLWEAHRTRGDLAARESLILRYVHLVRRVVGRLAIGLPAALDMDDVIGAGNLGLIRAVENYDPCRGVPFESYASTCIRGAVLDQLRALDLVSRSARQKAREIENAIASVQSELGRVPTDDEVAGQMGLDVDTYHKRIAESGVALISLDTPITTDGEDDSASLLSTIEDSSSPDPVSLAERRGLMEALAGAVARLGEREQLLLSLYYRDELTMREISEVMSVSESRVCQLHTRAVLKLRAQLRVWRQTDD